MQLPVAPPPLSVRACALVHALTSDTTCVLLACREVQWGYQSAHHSQNKVLEEAFARHQQAQLEQAETKARESQEVRTCVEQPRAAGPWATHELTLECALPWRALWVACADRGGHVAAGA